MKSVILFFGLLWIGLDGFAQPPYGGTIFFDPDIITAADSSALESVTYLGQANRVVFDRRLDDWTTINAFLFDVKWNDGLRTEAQINPEFQDVAVAEELARKYGFSVGQLPYCLRTEIDALWIHAGVALFGGGNRSILIHTGQTALYEEDGILEETLVHEAVHTSIDPEHTFAAGWLAAQQADGEFISAYAQDFPTREDLAESMLPWLAVRYRSDRISSYNYDVITNTIPNRLKYFDQIGCDLSPMVIQTNLYPVDPAEEITIYPNPAAENIQITGLPDIDWYATVFNSFGEKVHRFTCRLSHQIDCSRWPKGMYYIRFEHAHNNIIQSVVKQ